MPPHDSELNTEIRLYSLLIDQLQKYNSILWQAPAALFTANLLALGGKLLDQPSTAIAVAIFNGAFILALYRIVRAQETLIKTMRASEKALRNTDFQTYVPNFEESRFYSVTIFLVVMALLDLLMLGHAIFQTIHSMTKALLIIGILMQSAGSLGVGVSIWRDSREGKFDTMIGPWTRRAFWLYMLGYVPLLIGTWMTP
jgi:hypothetical protein